MINFKDISTINNGYVSGEGLVSVLNQFKHELVGVEVGVCRAETTCYLAEHCKNIKHITGIDPWTAYSDGVGIDVWTQEMCDEFYQNAKDNVAIGYQDKITLWKETSENAAKQIPDDSLDFVFVDGNHSYEFVIKDFELWYPKVKQYGIFAGHDSNTDGVQKALKEFTMKHSITKITPLKNTAWFFQKGV